MIEEKIFYKAICDGRNCGQVFRTGKKTDTDWWYLKNFMLEQAEEHGWYVKREHGKITILCPKCRRKPKLNGIPLWNPIWRK